MKAKDLIREIEERLHDLGNRTEAARTSTEVVEYLRFMGHFHQYSFHNTLSIWFHCPHATKVAGYKTWQKLGRHVKKGEEGIPILAPYTCRKTVEDEEGNEKEVNRTFFKVVYVFDVSQTEGEPLQEAPITAAGDGKGLLPVLERIADEKGITCEYKAMAESHQGTSYGGRIEIDARLDDAGKVSVIVHELAHELLHKEAERAELTRQQLEIEAEATSFIVCSHFGIDTAAANYLALWNANREKITESFQRIHQVAADLIESVGRHLKGHEATVGWQSCA